MLKAGSRLRAVASVSGRSDRWIPSEQKLVEPSQGYRFPAGEWLSVSYAGQLPPVTGAIAHRLDQAGLSCRLIFNQLRAETAQRHQFRLELVGYVHDQAWSFDNPQVNAEIVQDAGWEKRLAGNVRLGELAPEPRSSSVSLVAAEVWVRVGILPERCEQKPRPHLAEYSRQRSAMNQRRLETSVGKTEILPPRISQCGVGGRAVSAARRSGLPSGVGSPLVRSTIPTDQPCWISRTIVPPIPSSASSGWGATTKTSSMVIYRLTT